MCVRKASLAPLLGSKYETYQLIDRANGGGAQNLGLCYNNVDFV